MKLTELVQIVRFGLDFFRTVQFTVKKITELIAHDSVCSFWSELRISTEPNRELSVIHGSVGFSLVH